MTQAEQLEKVEVSWVDNEGNKIKVGSLVRIPDEVELGTFNSEIFEWENGRTFDFGEVTALNDDGTVSVQWDDSLCSCIDETGRVESPANLVVATETEYGLYYKGYGHGEEVGRKEFQSDLRNLLGLTQ